MYDKSMDLRAKVYQMFILSPSSTELLGGGNLEQALQNGLGGVIYFTKNIISKAQTYKLSMKIKDAALISPFISIDQEGGRVERTENIFNGKRFLSARLQAEKGLEFVHCQSKEIAELLLELGCNMNFAPVLDVDTNPANPIIAERSYSADPDKVVEYAICAMKVYMANNIIPVGKHFPGHGDVNADSHLTLPVLELSRKEVEAVHIRPFYNAIQNGLPAVMVAHLYCPCFDKKKVPASLSQNVLSYLRKEIGFKGVIVSDDMQMGALDGVEPLDAIISGINAGVNLFLYRDCSNNTIDIIEAIVSKARRENLLEQKIEESFVLIQKLKEKFRLI